MMPRLGRQGSCPMNGQARDLDLPHALLDLVLGKLERVRRVGSRWQALCPAHPDRRPSLSVADGRTAVLLHCWSGCNIGAICEAIGVKVEDLFYSRRRHNEASRHLRASPTPISTSRVRVALAAEIARYRHRERLAPEQRLLASEHNACRAVVARQFGIHLAALPHALWDDANAGRERDPAWPTLVWRAIWLASIEIEGEPIDYDPGAVDWRRRHIPLRVLLRAEELAVEAMRSIERETGARCAS
jgi:transposase-like protein